MNKRILLGAAAVALVIAAAYAAFYVAPEERTMGVLQRIFYFHASSAWAGMDAFLICFVANLLYIWKRDAKYDWLGVSAAEVGAGAYYCGANYRGRSGRSRPGESGGRGTRGLLQRLCCGCFIFLICCCGL